MKSKLFVSFVRQLLTEEVFGTQAFVYHGSHTDPDTMADILKYDEFDPGQGSGSTYGNGLYTIYDPEDNTPTMSGGYGDYIYKLKINLHGFVIFDASICQKVYGKTMTPFEQLDLLGYGHIKEQIQNVIARRKMNTILSILYELLEEENQGTVFTSDQANEMSVILKKYVKGIVFTGRQDGKVCLIYDTSSVVPVGWRKVDSDNKSYNKFDKHVMKPALARSAEGKFEPGRFNP